MLSNPEDVANRFADAWNRGDADAIAALFTDDADFVNVVGFWWTRREQIRHNHAYGFAHIFPGSTMSIERLRVRDLGDTAVVHARWRIEGQSMPSGGDGGAGEADDGAPGYADDGGPGYAGDRRGIFVFVTRRQKDGTLRAVAAQNTDIVPGAQTLVADGSGPRTDGSGLRPARYDDP
ncbi:SgcJ/EcaC family oxidoreductase [Ornithinimicrobium sp. F0845]|uniref:YybH family protein n=1 Tax=Ornithinimicrobium sp. F0845 TaxID=2926412 RepID=UPI001FF66AE6|nr:SgcJ/EcaC family oxidoreductase [Ornithinimicrobium sp. F0845]MCK0112102.1 SgcJ/EcaC family oxidoreductase [Ornithinimicrobium sp. F0845]